MLARTGPLRHGDAVHMHGFMRTTVRAAPYQSRIRSVRLRHCIAYRRHGTGSRHEVSHEANSGFRAEALCRPQGMADENIPYVAAAEGHSSSGATPVLNEGNTEEEEKQKNDDKKKEEEKKKDKPKSKPRRWPWIAPLQVVEETNRDLAEKETSRDLERQEKKQADEKK